MEKEQETPKISTSKLYYQQNKNSINQKTKEYYHIKRYGMTANEYEDEKFKKKLIYKILNLRQELALLEWSATSFNYEIIDTFDYTFGNKEIEINGHTCYVCKSVNKHNVPELFKE